MHPPIHHRRRHPARLAALAAATMFLIVGCQRAMPLGPAGVLPAGNDPRADAQSAPPRVTPAIRFALRPPATFTLRIYDVQGSLVRTIGEDVLVAGVHEIVWDGFTDAGLPVGSGFYTYRLDFSDGDRIDGTLIVVR